MAKAKKLLRPRKPRAEKKRAENRRPMKFADGFGLWRNA